MKCTVLVASGFLLAISVSPAGAMPSISGYGHSGCIAKGDRLVIRGQGFKDLKGVNRLVLWAQGLEVEVPTTLWEDSQITGQMPTDARIQAGLQYEVRLSARGGGGLPVVGPMITICGEEPPAGPAPAAPGPAAATPAVPTAVPPAPAPPESAQVADRVLRASGADQWANVKSIQFTFNVAEGDKQVVSAQHDWDVRAGTDKVTWGGKTVTVSTRKPAADADAQAAYKRWVNDSYWLLAPLKLRDPGVTVAYGGRETMEGKEYEVLRLRFDKVGVTAGDRYVFYVDPASSLVRYWDYLPDATRKVTGSWEGYQDFGGLRLSTEHQFGGKRVWFTDVKVVK